MLGFRCSIGVDGPNYSRDDDDDDVIISGSHRIYETHREKDRMSEWISFENVTEKNSFLMEI